MEPTLKPETHWLHLWALLHFLQWALLFLHLAWAAVFWSRGAQHNSDARIGPRADMRTKHGILWCVTRTLRQRESDRGCTVGVRHGRTGMPGGGILTQDPAEPTLKPWAQVLHLRALLHLVHLDTPALQLHSRESLLTEAEGRGGDFKGDHLSSSQNEHGRHGAGRSLLKYSISSSGAEGAGSTHLYAASSCRLLMAASNAWAGRGSGEEAIPPLALAS